MSFSLALGSRPIIAMAVNRQSKDFTERERAILNIVRPHFAQAYANAGLATMLKRALDLGNVGMMVITHRGQVKVITPAAERCLAEFFGRRSSRSRRLPDAFWQPVRQELSAWAEKGDRLPTTPSPWEIEKGDQTLIVHLYVDQVPDQCLIFVRKKTTAATAVALQSLGLGPREAQVLYWLMQGKSNAEIGTILDLNPGTVKKHLDRVYDKLGVYNRVGAAMHALESLGLIAQK